MARLRIEDSGESRTVDLDRDLFVFGRSKKCSVRLKDGRTSSRHCQLCRLDGQWYIEDLRSRNKTFLNDRAIEGRTPIQGGDRIAIGEVRIAFEEEAAAAPSAAAPPAAAPPPSPPSPPPADVALVLPWRHEADASPREEREDCGDAPSPAPVLRREPARLLALLLVLLALLVVRDLLAQRPRRIASVPPPSRPAPDGITGIPRDQDPPRSIPDGTASADDGLDLPQGGPDAPGADLHDPSAPAVRGLLPLDSEIPQRGPADDHTFAVPQGSGSQFVMSALDWLARHQRADGSWSAAGFADACQGGRCGGPGEPCYDVGVTALAVLAFEGAGFSHLSKGRGEQVRRALVWLMRQQREDGSFGPKEKKYLYANGVATLAFLQALHMTKAPQVRRAAERAVSFLLTAQTPKEGWRYIPERGQSDSSVTTWMALCLSAARKEGIPVPDTAWEGIRIWVLKKTDPATGRIGYRERDDRGSRLADGVDRFPPQEAMAACGLMCRLATGKGVNSSEVAGKVADRLRARPPEWDEEKGLVDEYYWFFGTLAGRAGDLHVQEKWDPALKKALIGHQVKEGCQRGSWDPVDPWGTVGGRVYSTAMGAMSLELLVDGSLEALRP